MNGELNTVGLLALQAECVGRVAVTKTILKANTRIDFITLRLRIIEVSRKQKPRAVIETSDLQLRGMRFIEYVRPFSRRDVTTLAAKQCNCAYASSPIHQ